MNKIVVLQRESHVAVGVFSLSVSARITEALDYLRDAHQLEYVVVAENDDVAENALNWGDVLILSKHSSAEALELVIKAKKKGVLVIYDIDDWIFSFPSYSGGGAQSKNRVNMYRMIDEANYVTVANKTIFSEILKHRHDAVLIPNGMYVDKYIQTNSFIDTEECTPPRIIFTNADLLKIANSKDTFVNVLHEFFRRHPEYVMDFFGDPFPEMFSMSFLHFSNRMSYQDYMIALINGKYQFSITPLGGSEDADSWFFNSCKNPFKYLNYGAACVPGIYSNSPIYENAVENNETGILVENSKSSWLDSLELMASDSALRHKIRKNAFWDVVENHHIKYSAEKLISLF
ncbi:MAG: hypothetical protein QM500_01055 [Methylococcales bacterium]